MGSPYFVHKQVNRVHVVKSAIGFERILAVISRSMDRELYSILTEECGPEWGVLNDLLEGYNQAVSSRTRTVVFLEARYDWQGWEKFQRVIIFDFSGKNENLDLRIARFENKGIFIGASMDTKDLDPRVPL